MHCSNPTIAPLSGVSPHHQPIPVLGPPANLFKREALDMPGLGRPGLGGLGLDRPGLGRPGWARPEAGLAKAGLVGGWPHRPERAGERPEASEPSWRETVGRPPEAEK